MRPDEGSFYKPISVLYEDPFYLVVDKPARLLVIPTVQQERNTLARIVNVQFASKQKEWNLHPCHRLDRDTSGAIIFAKGKSNQKGMMELFKRKAVGKQYLAFVRGRLKERSGEIKSVIRDLHQKRFAPQAGHKLAITRFKVKEIRKHFSVVEVWPITGRTNQIRIHFSRIGHPLLGERQYAFGRDFELKFRRVALHASTLEWAHPVYKKVIKVISPLPKDMEEFLHRHP